jgi:hypothetical protein
LGQEGALTAATFIVPYQRNSPIRVPRRDLVIGAADSLLVRVTIVHSDDPSAPALELTGGINGPALRFIIWADWVGSGNGWTDYGRGSARRGDVLWSGVGVAADAVGSFDVTMAANTVSGWPVRCGFSAQLDWDGAARANCCARAAAHHARLGHAPVIPILTDPLGDEILLA